ncbi:MAG: putative glycine dehydrogenase (decarboxylating) subunit 1 [Candidatus Marinimicrobia bacterium]|nr:putative glycine dehydrogenase (decarboxylating) subunit 1 [Candidatus Neomarinimicrobiota bacterium]
MQYVGNTPAEQQEMLEAIGVSSFEELLEAIPETFRVKGLLDLPKPVSEIEMRALAAALNKNNRSTEDAISFLGGGAYDHYIPTIVDFLIFRSEFYTAYTPYQPEVSQGTLQAMYEYQSMICELTGMDVSNASLYDGGSGLGEAALMAVRVSGKDVVLVSETVNPHYREIIETYCSGQDITVKSVPMDNGRVGGEALGDMLSNDVGGVIIQSPNYFGHLEDANQIGALVRDKAPKALYTIATNPISLGILKPPAEADADIVVAEGQGLGNHQSFGGPYLGVFALKEKYVRKMPGRLIGATVGQEGERGFVLVLKTREQDIRRERATSNICTNQGLNALAATVYMSSLGNEGIRHVSSLNTQKAHYLAEQLSEIDGVSLEFPHPFYNEFVVKLPVPAKEVITAMLAEDIFAGIDPGKKYEGFENRLLIAVTEKRTRNELDAYVKGLKKVLKGKSMPETV